MFPFQVPCPRDVWLELGVANCPWFPAFAILCKRIRIYNNRIRIPDSFCVRMAEDDTRSMLSSHIPGLDDPDENVSRAAERAAQSKALRKQAEADLLAKRAAEADAGSKLQWVTTYP